MFISERTIAIRRRQLQFSVPIASPSPTYKIDIDIDYYSEEFLKILKELKISIKEIGKYAAINLTV